MKGKFCIKQFFLVVKMNEMNITTLLSKQLRCHTTYNSKFLAGSKNTIFADWK